MSTDHDVTDIATSDPVPTAPRAHADPDVFARRYLAHATDQLPDHGASTLAALARDALRFGAVRPAGRVLVRVVDLNGDSSALDVVVDDAPFLVDSVRAELERSGVQVDHVLHPQLIVRRDAGGVLAEVQDVDDDGPVPGDAQVESWMHVETGLIPAGERDALVARLHRVLEDVGLVVADEPAMRALIRSLADDLIGDPGRFDRETSEEAGELLRWLAEGNVMLLGHAAYSGNDLAAQHAQPTDARGVLRGAATISAPELLPAFRSGAPVVIFKSPLVSTVRRSARYDCITVVGPDRDGEQLVHVFLGLITSSEDEPVVRVPLVRRRIAEILVRSGARANSYSGRQLLAALRTLPRDELLEAPTADLLRLAQLLVDRTEHGGVGVFARIHLNHDFASVLVYFPADRFGPETRRKVRQVVSAHWPGEVIGRDDRIVELGSRQLARMQVLVQLRPGEPVPAPERRTVESEIAAVTRRWSDDVADLLAIASASATGAGDDAGQALIRRYGRAFPEAYKEDFSAATAVRDVTELDALDPEDGLGFHAYLPPDDDPADHRLKVLRTGTPLSLARALPIFAHLGIEVLDERPYELDLADGRRAWIYDFGLRLPAGAQFDVARPQRVVEALRLLWREQIEGDGFNALVLVARLTSWQVTVLRAYAKYLRQVGSTFSQGYIEQALVDNPTIARLLVELFEARFDPARAGTAQLADDGRTPIVEAVEAELAGVQSLDRDRILRSLLGLVSATTRTNAYQRDASGARREALAFKFDPRLVADLPAPRPRYEIWVYSPRVEGVHLRFGPIARGGLRWSDRREDFRTEILGLVKAQMVKNAVIVPVGSKGGFVAKRLPDPQADRDAWLAEGVACYRTFVSCLLDVTDNYGPDIEDGRRRVVPPADTRRYDGDDPYLVVAADKGTASFSDIANEIAVSRGYWLGDAFASGGSVGYDHKAMGITARGAWESVRYHFRELGLNTQTQDFTVVGIGDMSGDVFGNGMLLSQHIRLVVAFDHRHVFVDPDPDAATSFAERRRLWDLSAQRPTSWADYDPARLSAGGGVYPRSAKSVPIGPEVRRALDLPDDVRHLTPTELIHAALLAPVDLLWNGGIGTYVKATTEPQSAAGDKANDAVRVDGAQLRCRVVGEGGNLGLTQLGRIEYARAGGRINTDAVDNSAGVDTSDHEVNIKILLDRAVTAGALPAGERNPLLASVTDQVAAHVLADNYEQNVLLGLGRAQAPALINVHRRYLKALEEHGELDRALEFLPDDRELGRRSAAGEGLASPELAVMMAYTKIVLTERITDSTLPDEPWFGRALVGYFPAPIAERLAGSLAAHPLHREIITTCVVNDLVNRGGSTFVHRACEETGVDEAQVARAYTVVREVFGLERLWADIAALDGVAPAAAQNAAHLEIRRLLDRGTRWLVDNRFPISDVAREIARFGPTIAELTDVVPQLLCGEEADNHRSECQRLVGLGLPADLSARIAVLLSAFLLLDVVEIVCSVSGRPDTTPQQARTVAELHYALSERFSIDLMLTKITLLPRDDRWSSLARGAMRHDVYAALSAITASVLAHTDAGLGVEERIATWENAHHERVARTRGTVHDALRRDTVDLATLSVALRMMRSLPS